MSKRERVISWVVVVMIVIVLVLLLWPPLQSRRTASPRSQCKNNLKQIGLALHNYHDEYGSFPPAYIADEEGRPMHSWRVLILPYVDQGPLYREYRFDEPWNGPHNSRLADRIQPPVFRCPSEDKSTNSSSTSYMAVVGSTTAWPAPSARPIGEMPDGTSNILLVVEVANSGIHWMEPRDLHVAQMSPLVNPEAGQGISSEHQEGAHVLIADGSVRFLYDWHTAETVRQLLDVRDGQPEGGIPEKAQ